MLVNEIVYKQFDENAKKAKRREKREKRKKRRRRRRHDERRVVVLLNLIELLATKKFEFYFFKLSKRLEIARE